MEFWIYAGILFFLMFIIKIITHNKFEITKQLPKLYQEESMIFNPHDNSYHKTAIWKTMDQSFKTKEDAFSFARHYAK